MTLEIVILANDGGNHQVCTDPRRMRGNVNGAINQDTAWKSMSR